MNRRSANVAETLPPRSTASVQFSLPARFTAGVEEAVAAPARLGRRSWAVVVAWADRLVAAQARVCSVALVR